MRVLLQNTETNLYFIGAEQWTEDPIQATDLEDIEHAAQVYQAQNLAYARIVLHPTVQDFPRLPVWNAPRQIRAGGL